MEQKSVGIRIAPFALGILCFILPFMDISCSGEKVMSFTGVQLVTGAEMENPMSDETEKIPPNTAAIMALVALGLGVVFSLGATRNGAIFAAIAGAVAFAAMLIMKTNLDAELLKGADGMPIFAEYKAGFWGVCIAALVGAVLSFMRMKGKAVPPAGATPTEPGNA